MTLKNSCWAFELVSTVYKRPPFYLNFLSLYTTSSSLSGNAVWDMHPFYKLVRSIMQELPDVYTPSPDTPWRRTTHLLSRHTCCQPGDRTTDPGIVIDARVLPIEPKSWLSRNHFTPFLKICPFLSSIQHILVVKSQVRLFADDCLLYRPIKTRADQIIMQQDLDSLKHWSDLWQKPQILSI